MYWLLKFDWLMVGWRNYTWGSLLLSNHMKLWFQKKEMKKKKAFIGEELTNLYILCLFGRSVIGRATGRVGWNFMRMLEGISGGTRVDGHLRIQRASSSFHGMRLNKSVSKSFWDLKGWQAPWPAQKFHGFCWSFRWRQQRRKPVGGVLFCYILQSI